MTDIGKSPRAFQTIKSKLKCERYSLAATHKGLTDLSVAIEKESEISDKSLKQQQRCPGYIQSYTVTNNELRIVLFDEAMVRLYHERCQRDPLYIDATGTLTEKLKNYPRILYYCFAVRHPFGGSSALPVAEYISSTHTIRFPLINLFDKEKKLFGLNIYPRLIILDFSYALIIACLNELCKEDVCGYLNRTFRIIRGDASADDLNKSLLHVCIAHIMNNSKRFLNSRYPKDGAKKNFAMRMVGRLIHVRDLGECKQIVSNFKIVLMNEYDSPASKKSRKFLEDAVNSFDIPHEEDVEDCCELENYENSAEDVEELDRLKKAETMPNKSPKLGQD